MADVKQDDWLFLAISPRDEYGSDPPWNWVAFRLSEHNLELFQRFRDVIHAMTRGIRSTLGILPGMEEHRRTADKLTGPCVYTSVYGHLIDLWAGSDITDVILDSVNAETVEAIEINLNEDSRVAVADGLVDLEAMKELTGPCDVRFNFWADRDVTIEVASKHSNYFEAHTFSLEMIKTPTWVNLFSAVPK
jgi:hypothetical protein